MVSIRFAGGTLSPPLLSCLPCIQCFCAYFPVPLGSIPELPADSCGEIKASEGAQAVSGNYWLDYARSGNSILAHCDMKTESENNKHLCLVSIKKGH